MILLATNRRDVTTDFIVRELERRETDFVRLNTESISEWTVEIPNGNVAEAIFRKGSRSFNVGQVAGAYYRRPLPPVITHHDPATVSYLQDEWSAVLRSLWNALEGRWLNSPFAILRAEDKPRQLALARQCGLLIPETLVTNEPERARDFVNEHTCIAKPLRHALIEDGGPGRVIFTSRIEELSDQDAQSIRKAPIIFQREIKKHADIRVIVVDRHIFATQIDSQAHEETSVDWRKGVRTDLRHGRLELPAAINEACISVTARLGLRYSAIDLVLDPDENFWFLEANPNGQWAWIQQRTSAPIAAAITDGLLQ